MSRFVFRLPHVTFEREWVLGPATFRPAGALLTEVNGLPDFTAQVKNYGLLLDPVRGMAQDWAADATVEVEANEDAGAVELASQAVPILRLFMRPEVPVNVGLHKIGLVGDVSLAVRELIEINQSGRVGFGGRRVDGPVPFTFTRAVLDKWDADPGMQFLATQLSSPVTRSHFGSRALTAIAMLDIGFMASKPTVKVLSFAVAIEAMLSREPPAPTKDQRTESPLSIARRVAYLTCQRRCGRSAPSCLYIKGFSREKAFREFVRQYTQKGEDWRCSAFMRIACPPDLSGAIGTPSQALFSARHQVAHDGTTTATERDIKWFNHLPTRQSSRRWNGSPRTLPPRSPILTMRSTRLHRDPPCSAAGDKLNQAANRQRTPCNQPVPTNTQRHQRQGRKHDHSIAAGHGKAVLVFTWQRSPQASAWSQADP